MSGRALREGAWVRREGARTYTDQSAGTGERAPSWGYFSGEFLDVLALLAGRAAVVRGQ